MKLIDCGATVKPPISPPPLARLQRHRSEVWQQEGGLIGGFTVFPIRISIKSSILLLIFACGAQFPRNFCLRRKFCAATVSMTQIFALSFVCTSPTPKENPAYALGHGHRHKHLKLQKPRHLLGLVPVCDTRSNRLRISRCRRLLRSQEAAAASIFLRLPTEPLRGRRLVQRRRSRGFHLWLLVLASDRAHRRRRPGFLDDDGVAQLRRRHQLLTVRLQAPGHSRPLLVQEPIQRKTRRFWQYPQKGELL